MVGNPHDEAHGLPMRVYDWIAPAGTDPLRVAATIEAALGCKLYHRGDGEQHGYVNTSTRPDGSLWVGVLLYDQDCDDPACPAGHGANQYRKAVACRKAPAVTKAALAKAVKAVGEHSVYKLTGDDAKDEITLRCLGYADHDGPMPEPVKQAAEARFLAEIAALNDPSPSSPAGAPDGAEGPSQQDPGRV